MKWLWVIGILAIVGLVSAAPITGPAQNISSNGFNVSVSGVGGTDVWITWGDITGGENWVTPNATATGSTTIVQVFGAPIFGGEHVFFQACDVTGCGNEMSTTISAVTPMPATNYGQFLTNITRSRFAPDTITQGLMSGYTQSAPQVVLIGIAALMFMFGIWMRTKSVRMILILGMLIIPFLRFSTSGLYLGLPSTGWDMLQGLISIGLGGVLVAIIRK